MLCNMSDGDEKTNPVIISKVVILGLHSVGEMKQERKSLFFNQKNFSYAKDVKTVCNQISDY